MSCSQSCCSKKKPRKPSRIQESNAEASSHPETYHGEYIDLDSREDIPCAPGSCSHIIPCPNSTIEPRVRFISPEVPVYSSDAAPGRESRSTFRTTTPSTSAARNQLTKLEDHGEKNSTLQRPQRKRPRHSNDAYPSDTEVRAARSLDRSGTTAKRRGLTDCTSGRLPQLPSIRRPSVNELQRRANLDGMKNDFKNTPATRQPLDGTHTARPSHALRRLGSNTRSLNGNLPNSPKRPNSRPNLEFSEADSSDVDFDDLSVWSLEEKCVLILHSIFKSPYTSIRRTQAFTSRQKFERFIERRSISLVEHLDIEPTSKTVNVLDKDELGWQRVLYEVQFPTDEDSDPDMPVIVPHDFIAGPIKSSFIPVLAECGMIDEEQVAKLEPGGLEYWESWVEVGTLDS
ncbi:hypothetical protein AOL_s00079g377 [Orbilia oligospora ATCC 24927]|uniref:Uncharacterized protein n=2 Tax=Orbilia oligospora TaxID=2813651 RepID=G1XDJ2_ARTOA|nr:hypothetical protein AOL_s00079g377 [Orbilia oligospora ATCC 24927]EGX48738.1 hypothetical protein AOL_s00079g377 [Orbilia oligospora ATCC 24927]KAF3287403.1 hypothetical protein TWF970_007127 [Orbilia oligospora]